MHSDATVGDIIIKRARKVFDYVVVHARHCGAPVQIDSDSPQSMSIENIAYDLDLPFEVALAQVGIPDPGSRQGGMEFAREIGLHDGQLGIRISRVGRVDLLTHGATQKVEA